MINKSYKQPYQRLSTRWVRIKDVFFCVKSAQSSCLKQTYDDNYDFSSFETLGK